MNRAGKLFCFFLCLSLLSVAVNAQEFKAGSTKRDITPSKPTPMWGYGDRHAALSTGVIDPLFAKGTVFEAGDKKLAVVTMDIGRGPTAQMMKVIRESVKETAGVEYVLISGSHTHHGPVIELIDEPGKGRGTYDDAVAYAKELESKIIEVIVEAASKAVPAKIGWGSAHVDMNRNRQQKSEPKARDTELSVVRVDDLEGKPISMFVNFAAHPTRLPSGDLRFSAEYPGHLMNAVESALGGLCQFVQGAAGDMSMQSTDETRTIEAFGKALAAEALKINEGITTKVPDIPSIQCVDNEFSFESRAEFARPETRVLLKIAFFPELVDAFMVELEDGRIRPHLTTALLNGELFWVGASGEFFCNHSNRLKERARGVRTIFQGYCNGHHMYFPTIEAASEGGYGADARVSWVPLGAGEEMMDRALINLYTMQGKFGP